MKNLMPSLFIYTIIMLLTGSFVSTLNAQLPFVDIGLFENPTGSDTLEVRIKPNTSFQGLYSNSVFTLRWPTSSGLSLDAVIQTPPVQFYHPITKSGGEITNNGYTYQTFVGFGFVQLSSFGVSWSPNTEYVMMRIAVNGGTPNGVFQIINDTWTNNNNVDHYQELNASNQTGIIYHNMPLPVELLNFEAYAYKDTDVKLTWTTLTEIESSHFEIERSIDGMNWKTVGQVAASGNSNYARMYQFADEKVYHMGSGEVTYYYRLKIVDINGAFEYSSIESINFYVSQLHVFPNPASTYLTIQISDLRRSSDLVFEIIGLHGKLIKTGVINPGSNTINTQNLSSGMFVIGIYNGQGRSLGKKRFIIQK